MFVYKQLHPAAAIICAVATLTIAVVGATSPSFCHLCLLPPSLLLLSCQRYRRHASYCRHPALNYRHFARVRSKVEFVARIGDCQACNNDCKPRNHYFPPRNQNKHHLHPCRKGLSLCCMCGDGDEGNGCGAALFIGNAIASSKVVSLPL